MDYKCGNQKLDSLAIFFFFLKCGIIIMVKHMKELVDLYVLFFKIGLQTFGGGYSMLPRLQKKFVDDLSWITEEEMLNYITVGQCTPGVISVNISTFIGYKRKKTLGAIVATLGMITPSFLLILLFAVILRKLVGYQFVIHGLAGVRIAVCALIFSTFLTLYKKSIIDNKTFGIFLTVVIFGIFTNLKPVYFVIYGGILGFILSSGKDLTK